MRIQSLHLFQSIKYLQRSDYTLPRTILDLLLLDRLRQLEEKDTHRFLQYSIKVALSMYVKDDDGNDEKIKGEAGWVIGYGADKARTGSIFLVLEAESTDLALAGMAQLLLTMTAVQISRRNRVIYGMLSDGNTFQFAFLDQDKKLCTSKSFEWLWDQSTIVAYIDKILTESLESYPAPSPERTGFHIGKISRDGEGNGTLEMTRRTRNPMRKKYKRKRMTTTTKSTTTKTALIGMV